MRPLPCQNLTRWGARFKNLVPAMVGMSFAGVSTGIAVRGGLRGDGRPEGRPTGGGPQGWVWRWSGWCRWRGGARAKSNVVGAVVGGLRCACPPYEACASYEARAFFDARHSARCGAGAGLVPDAGVVVVAGALVRTADPTGGGASGCAVRGLQVRAAHPTGLGSGGTMIGGAWSLGNGMGVVRRRVAAVRLGWYGGLGGVYGCWG